LAPGHHRCQVSPSQVKSYMWSPSVPSQAKSLAYVTRYETKSHSHTLDIHMAMWPWPHTGCAYGYVTRRIYAYGCVTQVT